MTRKILWQTAISFRLALFFVGCVFVAAVADCNEYTISNSLLSHTAFMGDSITAFWDYPEVNLGVPGNTTAQMLVRFPTEILGHGYSVVVILGGINDLNQSKPPKEALANITQMAKLANDAKIAVAPELTPEFRNNSSLDPSIRSLNAGIIKLATAQHYALVDYYDSMAGHPEYFKEGLHPNKAGYAVMDKIVAKALNTLSTD
jgi:lysophospholipase L1-like esterase